MFYLLAWWGDRKKYNGHRNTFQNRSITFKKACGAGAGENTLRRLALFFVWIIQQKVTSHPVKKRAERQNQIHRFQKKPEVALKWGLLALAINKATWQTKKKGQSLFWWYSRHQCEWRTLKNWHSQLKFWLKSRRINQRGKIKELLDRYVFHPSIVSISNMRKNLFSPFLLPKRTLFMVGLGKRIWMKWKL